MPEVLAQAIRILQLALIICIDDITVLPCQQSQLAHDRLTIALLHETGLQL
jgi:hypothetical protein